MKTVRPLLSSPGWSYVISRNSTSVSYYCSIPFPPSSAVSKIIRVFNRPKMQNAAFLAAVDVTHRKWRHHTSRTRWHQFLSVIDYFDVVYRWFILYGLSLSLDKFEAVETGTMHGKTSSSQHYYHRRRCHFSVWFSEKTDRQQDLVRYMQGFMASFGYIRALQQFVRPFNATDDVKTVARATY